jgi:hypothetical protein
MKGWCERHDGRALRTAAEAKMTPNQREQVSREAVQALQKAEGKLDELAGTGGDRKALFDLLSEELRDVRRRVQTAVDEPGECPECRR